MKLHLFPGTLLSLLLLCACGTAGSWTSYHATTGATVNSTFLSYSFEYPSSWTIEEGVNHITLVSDAALLQDVPKKLKPGQIIAELSLSANLSPEKMVDISTSGLRSIFQFGVITTTTVNGKPAAYREGTDLATGDLQFSMAVDLGNNTRALLTCRLAEGELEKWRESLFRIVQSVQVEE